MAILDVLRFPDERLRTIAAPVETITPELQQIVDDMFETMYAEEGIGLAATQVDIHQRIIVIDVSENREDQLVLINPEILEQSGSTGIEEGCLSVLRIELRAIMQQVGAPTIADLKPTMVRRA